MERNNIRMRKGFTLVEMLVVIGIIAILIGASLAGYNKMVQSADRAKAQELVDNVRTALVSLYEADGCWPKKLRTEGATDGKLDADTAVVLAKRGRISLTLIDGKLGGRDRLGIVTPWAAKVIERLGSSASTGSHVGGTSTIDDHTLHFAVDLNGDGVIEGASVGGETVDIRATAAVWCCGKDGKLESYSVGRKKDDVYSWSYGQTQNVSK